VIIAVLALGACVHRQPQPSYLGWRPVDIQPSATACADSAPRVMPPARVSDTLSLTAAMGIDQRDAWLARRVPGGWAWGPWPASANHVGVMWLRDATQKRAVLDALDSLSVPNTNYDPRAVRDSVVVLDTRWDAAELYDWMAYLLYSRAHASIPVHLNGWGVDTRRGRVVLGFEHVESVPAIADWLRALGAPCNLILAEQTGPMHVTSAVATTK
jgi:hypothetical protein